MSEIKVMFIMISVMSMLVLASMSVYVGFSNEFGVSYTDASYFNRTSDLDAINEQLQTDAEGIKETDLGGFKILLGVPTFIKTLVGSGNLLVNWVGDLGEQLGLPVYVTDNIGSIILVIALSSLVTIIWSRGKV